jgi:2-polyprenyl-3-methyl-5-hydroxy-6-metoxy-1,4-benzoquinol methylase
MGRADFRRVAPVGRVASNGCLSRMRPRKPNPVPNNRNTDWSQVADWYDDLVGDEGSEYHREVVHPGVLRLLGDVTGRAVLDVACGQGVLCRLLTERGATVVGVDGAAPLINAARERGPASIAYHVVDARELAASRKLIEASFDVVTCILAIQNIHPIVPVLEGSAKMLKPGGRFVMAMMHPHFRGARESHWGWDEATQTQYRRVDRYLSPRKTPIVTSPGKKDGRYTWTFHKPLEMYVRLLVRAGLMIDAIEEWPSHKVSQPGPRSTAENTARKEIPMFMAIRGCKAQG